MKGLLLKDWYMTKKYCRAYLLIAIVFIAVSFFSNGDMFFVFYPCLLCGMIPVNLMAYDERSRWIQYSDTLPYSRAQIVSSKYLIGLMAQMAMLLVTGIVQGIRMCMEGTFQMNEFSMLMLPMLIVSTLTPSICLPFVFKLGVEKGRIILFDGRNGVCRKRDRLKCIPRWFRSRSKAQCRIDNCSTCRHCAVRPVLVSIE